MEYKLGEITLRPVTSGDVHEVARMWDFEKEKISDKEAQEAIDWMMGNHQLNHPHKLVHFCLAIFQKDTNKIIGWCGLDGTNEENLIHIFYMLDKDFRRRGYATECAKKLLEYGFETVELDRIDGGCAFDNIGSRKILEKIGMKQTEDDKDGYRYFITADNYKQIYCK